MYPDYLTFLNEMQDRMKMYRGIENLILLTAVQQ